MLTGSRTQFEGNAGHDGYSNLTVQYAMLWSSARNWRRASWIYDTMFLMILFYLYFFFILFYEMPLFSASLRTRHARILVAVPLRWGGAAGWTIAPS